MDTVVINGVKAKVARGLFERMKGLIGVRHLPEGEGLLILKCNSIHTLFMSFAIDAVFFDRDDTVVKVVRNIPPWRFFVWGGFRASKVLEVPSAGSAVMV